MTRHYRIQKTAGRPDWSGIEQAPIDQCLWRPCGQIRAYAQLAYDDSRLYVHLHAEEKQIRAKNSGLLDQPCQDSCLELFFPEFAPSGTIRGNFYKCGNLTAQEHYLAWNRVDAECPDFHRPEYFGTMSFSE